MRTIFSSIFVSLIAALKSMPPVFMIFKVIYGLSLLILIPTDSSSLVIFSF